MRTPRTLYSNCHCNCSHGVSLTISVLWTATAYSYKPLELTYRRTLPIVVSLLRRDVTADVVTWLLPRHRRCLQRLPGNTRWGNATRIATRSRFGSPRLGSAILDTARRIHRFVYYCAIAGACFDVIILVWRKYATVCRIIPLSN
jgi:hypothetical protein